MRRLTRYNFIRGKMPVRRAIDRLLELNLIGRIEAELRGEPPPPRLTRSEARRLLSKKRAHFPRATAAPVGTGDMAGPSAAPPPEPPPRRIVKLDLRQAPSSMEMLAESWRGR